MENYKVIILGLGHVGTAAVRQIVQRNSLQLVAVYDTDPAKVCKDSGLLSGVEATGVPVSDELDAVLATEADVVLYYATNTFDEGNVSPTGVTQNVEEICRALASGKNVATPTLTYYAHKTAPEFYEKIDRVAKEHGVTYVQQGIYPGIYTPFITTVLGMLGGRIDQVIVYGGEDDYYNVSSWTKSFGFGKKPEEINTEYMENFIFSYYGPTVMEVADRLGIEWDEYSCVNEPLLAEVEMDTPHGKIMPGTVSGHILTMCVKKDGREVSGFHFVHKVHDKMQPLPSRKMRIEFKGELNNTIEFSSVFAKPDVFLTSAAPSINLIPQLVKAEPGFTNALDLPVGYKAK
ncbi:MAG: hypothetical protein IJ362_10180 [Oscillospiraceae bacterium]|nr:hypothetical protein [Oscillospiraceae bacterium]